MGKSPKKRKIDTLEICFSSPIQVAVQKNHECKQRIFQLVWLNNKMLLQDMMPT